MNTINSYRRIVGATVFSANAVAGFGRNYFHTSALHKKSYIFLRHQSNGPVSKFMLSSPPQISPMGSVENIKTNDGFTQRVLNYLKDISHLEEVRQAQAHVLNIKQELRYCGERKRQIIRDIDHLRNDLHNIHKDMRLTGSRVSDQYLNLGKAELELYTKERDLQKELSLADDNEQKLFNEFSNAISISYEKEKLHTNFIKMLGWFGTIMGSVITLIGTILTFVYNQNRLYRIQQDKVDSKALMARFDHLEKKVMGSMKQKLVGTPQESWSSYLNRHTRWMYSWAIPSKSK